MLYQARRLASPSNAEYSVLQLRVMIREVELYVARTRARDYLLVTSVDPPSEFLDDLRM
jgi:hypothetical protein